MLLKGTIMKPIRLFIVSLTVWGLLATTVCPVVAQPGRVMVRPGYRPFPPPPPPRPYYPPYYRGPSDFDKAMRIVGGVAAVTAAATGYYSPYYHNRVIVVPASPSVVVEKQVVVERPVYIEKRDVPLTSSDYYSPVLGATFVIQNMQIPGHQFTAARLTSTPLEGSPLEVLNLRKGDVITRLNNESVNSLAVLERHDGSTAVRYIRSGTTKVLMGTIYIPTSADLRNNSGKYIAP